MSDKPYSPEELAEAKANHDAGQLRGLRIWRLLATVEELFADREYRDVEASRVLASFGVPLPHGEKIPDATNLLIKTADKFRAELAKLRLAYGLLMTERGGVPYPPVEEFLLEYDLGGAMKQFVGRPITPELVKEIAAAAVLADTEAARAAIDSYARHLCEDSSDHRVAGDQVPEDGPVSERARPEEGDRREGSG